MTFRKIIFFIALFCFVLTTFSVKAQNEPQEKAIALIENAITALGGQAYLAIKSERAQGFVTPYRLINIDNPDSNETEPDKIGTQSFVDYILLPDKERVEFKNQGRLFIQSNSTKYNWTYDSDSELLRDQTQVQQQRFANTLRYQIDKILRGGWKSENVQISYLPRQELWPRQYGEGVRLTYSDNEEAEVFFDSQTKLPLALRFPKENYDGIRVKAENRFLRYLEFSGITAPYVVDLFENGKQILRINYETREFNAPIQEKLFIKPANAKSVR
ncbi:MAG: hypothetical protein WAQ98_09100 [Blastocatellia bacterium]